MRLHEATSLDPDLPERAVCATSPPCHRLAAVLLLVAGLIGGCDDADFPRDPNRTLETVLATGEMTVAAVDHPPWVVHDGEAPPSGAEPALIRAFADELGVEIAWRQLSAFDALEGLEQGEVDLAIGGFTRDAVAPHGGAAPTYGYFRETLLIAARPEAGALPLLEGATVFVPRDVMARKLVRDKDAVPVSEMREEIELVAVPHWRVEPLGLVPTGTKLREEKHVMAVPQGENAWLMRLETFLRSEARDMGDRLRDQQG